MLADSFVFTSHLGEVVSRAEYLSHLREKSVLLRAADPTDELVYVDGDVGIVQAELHRRRIQSRRALQGRAAHDARVDVGRHGVEGDRLPGNERAGESSLGAAPRR